MKTLNRDLRKPKLEPGSYEVFQRRADGVEEHVGCAWREPEAESRGFLEAWALFDVDRPGGFQRPGGAHPLSRLRLEFRGARHRTLTEFREDVWERSEVRGGTVEIECWALEEEFEL